MPLHWLITIERPLRLNFSFAAKRIKRLKATPEFRDIATSKKESRREREKEIRVGNEIQAEILALLGEMDGKRIYRNRNEFRKMLKSAFAGLMKVPDWFWGVMMNALSERDETADICKDTKGRPKPDPELRTYAKVPLNEDIHEYFERELKPRMPDAWIDEEKIQRVDEKLLDAVTIGRYRSPTPRHSRPSQRGQSRSGR